MKPSIGRIVTYRTRAGVDIAALVTAVIDDSPDEAVHLEQFPPPSVSADNISHQFGVPKAAEDATEFQTLETWRWPERVE